MNAYIPILNGTSATSPRIITRKIREAFFAPIVATPHVTLESMRQDFFTREIPYGEIIYREAKRNSLSPELVAAVVEAESDFRVRLVSHKNAQGLMQIVPETSRLMGCENPFNPAQNIGAGTKYLKILCDRFGDERLALAAYNAGEGNIERFGGIPPFGETRDYIERVSQRTRDYRLKIRRRFVAASHVSTAVDR